jgi:hypothetical protein
LYDFLGLFIAGFPSMSLGSSPSSLSSLNASATSTPLETPLIEWVAVIAGPVSWSAAPVGPVIPSAVATDTGISSFTAGFLWRGRFPDTGFLLHMLWIAFADFDALLPKEDPTAEGDKARAVDTVEEDGPNLNGKYL